MTFFTINRSMNSCEWKRRLFVQFSDVAHQPRLSAMTTSTVISHRLVVAVGVARAQFEEAFLKVNVVWHALQLIA
jgi:hypothetical protein